VTRSLAILAACVLASLATCAPALADDQIGPTDVSPASQTTPPPTFRLSARQAIAITHRLPQVRSVGRRYPDAGAVAFIAGPGLWDVEYLSMSAYRRGPTASKAQILVNGVTGRVMVLWTGRQAADYLARGHFGHLVDAPWCWALFCVLFLVPFVDFRRPRRMLHLDLLVLLAFSVSAFFFTRGEVEASVPLVYPVLLYLAARMLSLGFRPRARREKLVPHVPVPLLAGALVAVVSLRIALNIDAHQVIDAAAAGVVGAHRMMHHLPLWGHSPGHGDTYGPFNYIAYIPFEAIFPWQGKWTGTLAAAHAFSITFDLLTMLGLFVLGARLRRGRAGRHLGLALAFAWAAYPFTLLTLTTNANDTLVSALLVWALVAVASPPARGALVAVAAAAKFAPLTLAPLFAVGTGRARRRGTAVAGATTLALFVLVIAAYLPKDGGLATFWHATLGYQTTRPTSFSPWALHPSLGWLQTLLEVAGASLALAVAFVPRRRDIRQVAALAAAVLIATELPARHWFYFYIVWFLPFVLFALFSQHRTDPRPRAADEIETAAIVGAARRAVP
jgi:hypothetical protein